MALRIIVFAAVSSTGPVARGLRTSLIDISDLLKSCDAPRSKQAEFVCKLRCPAEEPVLAEALSPWWDVRFTDETFDELCAASSRYALAFQATIRQERVFYRSCSRRREDPRNTGLLPFIELVLALSKITSLPDMVFNFNVGDQPFTDKVYWTAAPQLHWVVAKGHWTIPLPTPLHLERFGKNLLGDNPVFASRADGWRQRAAKVYWRGSASIPDNTVKSMLNTTSRMRLMRLARERPDIFDVAFTGIDDEIDSILGREVSETLRTSFRIERPVNFFEKLPKFKFVVNVAAVLSSWRLPDLLGSGALVFLQESSDLDLIHAMMTPWVHFIPVRDDLSDLVEKVDYMIANDDEAQRVANAGLQFYRANITRAGTACYVWRALSSIAGNSDITRRAADTYSNDKSWVEVTNTDALKHIASIGRSEL